MPAGRLPSTLVLFLTALTLFGSPVHAQTREAEQDVIDADRPHVGTGPHLIAPGQAQVELGGQYLHVAEDRGAYGSPVLIRAGVTNLVEARLGFDGVIGRIDGGERSDGVGNLQAGAKIRLWSDSRGEPLVSVMPTVTFGLASADKRLGSGATDTAIVLLASREVGRWHVEGNYGIGSIGSSDGQPHFPQHLVTAAVVNDTTAALSTYVEGVWVSRQERDGGAVTFTDFGVIYGLNRRLLVDAGASIGLSNAAPSAGVFAGCSFLMGEARRAPHSRGR
jgi:hypothetical protein